MPENEPTGPPISPVKIKPKLLRWKEDVHDMYPLHIPLTAISRVQVGTTGWLELRMAGGSIATSSDPDTIQRFWAQWEIV